MTDGDLQRVKKEKQRLTSRIDLTKREINRIRSSTGSEEAKIQSIKDDLDMITNGLNTQKEKEAKLKEEREKLEKKVEVFNVDRNASLEKAFKLEIEEMLLTEKKNVISTITKVSEPTTNVCSYGYLVFWKEQHRFLQSKGSSRVNELCRHAA